MIVTQIEAINKKKSKVYIEGQLAFVLYKGELSRYGIKENHEIEEPVYEEIVGKVLVKRAKLYSMNLLQSMDRTEMQLRRKLKEKFYPAEVVDQALTYVKSYRYIDDDSYAERYIEFNKARKSRQQIILDLMKKGVGREVIEQVYEKREPVDESVMIRKWIDKRIGEKTDLTMAEKQKLYAFLMRKGFASSDINRVMRERDINHFSVE